MTGVDDRPAALDENGDPLPRGSARKVPSAPGISSQQLIDLIPGTVPDYMRIDKREWLGDHDINVDRYIEKRYADLERERIWKRVWQFACREEEIPNSGDTYVYDIMDISILLVRTRNGTIKAYYNACLHQGRQIRETSGSCGKELRCPFHGFCWDLDGQLVEIPSRWDFPQIDPAEFSLPEVKVGTWGGFVFVNLDPEAGSLEDYLGDLGMHWEKFPLEERYTAVHTAKVLRANWKVAQEAFMEAFHNMTTHLQFGIAAGGQNDTGQYDPFENYSRALGFGQNPELALTYEPTRQEIAEASGNVGDPDIFARARATQPDDKTMSEWMLEVKREHLRGVVGDKIDDLSILELAGGGYFTVFPNFHPWWSYDEIAYRFRPWGDDPEECLMETYLLRPFKGERPPPAEVRWLDRDQSHLEVAELGPLGRIFFQDEYNIPKVQRGLHTLREHKRGTTLGVYQATKLRHFHNKYDEMMGLVDGEIPK